MSKPTIEQIVEARDILVEICNSPNTDEEDCDHLLFAVVALDWSLGIAKSATFENAIRTFRELLKRRGVTFAPNPIKANSG